MHVIHAPSVTDTRPLFWLSGRQLARCDIDSSSANSTLGDALASFAANPGKEITDTHNAVFCLSAKKKTSPLSPEREGGKKDKNAKDKFSPVLVHNQEALRL